MPLLPDLLDRIAQGKSHDRQALDAAMALPDIDGHERALLRRYKYGSHTAADHLKLQDLAIKIRGLK